MDKSERFLLTLMHLQNCMDIIIRDCQDKATIRRLKKVKSTIKYVIGKNTDEITLPEV